MAQDAGAAGLRGDERGQPRHSRAAQPSVAQIQFIERLVFAIRSIRPTPSARFSNGLCGRDAHRYLGVGAAEFVEA